MKTYFNSNSSCLFKYSKNLLILTLVLVMMGCGSTQTKPNDESGISLGLSLLSEEQLVQYRQGLKLMQSADYKKAKPLFVKLRAQNPSVNELSLNLALCLYHQKQYKEVMPVVSPLLQNNVAPAHNLVGLIKQDEGDFDSAKSHYQKAITLKPNYANALYNMALLYDVYYQNVDDAIKFYTLYLAQVDSDEQTKGWLDQLKSSYE